MCTRQRFDISTLVKTSLRSDPESTTGLTEITLSYVCGMRSLRSIDALPKSTHQYSVCAPSIGKTQRVLRMSGRSRRVARKNLLKYAEKSSNETSFAASDR